MSTFESYIEFYQRILRVHDKDDSIIINRVEEGILKRGCMSVVYRVSVFGSIINNDNKRKNYQRSMVVKRLPSGEMQGKYRTRVAMDNEKVAYSTIIPALKNHTFGFLPVGSTIFIGEDFIILPDLQTEGFFPVGTSAGGLTVSQCETALEGLAKLHAASFVFKSQDLENFTRISKLTQEIMKKHIGEIEKAFLSNLKEHLEASNRPRALAALEELSLNLERIEHLLKKPEKDLSVICHGDCWAGNMLFNETGELQFIDLQLMRYNSIATDLSYLFYVNLDPEEHEENMQRLLERYLELLKKYTKEKGVDLDDRLTMTRLEKEMRTYRVFGVFYGMWTSPVFYISEKELEETSPLKNYNKLGNLENAKCAERVTQILLRYVDAACEA